MQVTQLSMYSRNVPKFDARVIVSKLLGNFAIVSWVKVPEARPEAVWQSLDRGIRECATIAEDHQERDAAGDC